MPEIIEIITGGIALGLSRLIAIGVYNLCLRVWVRVIRPRFRDPDRK